MHPLPVGKLPAPLLASMLEKLPARDARVVSRGRIGEDAAAIDFCDRYLIAKTDPVTFATDEIGSYAVHVNANDVACRGAQPRWFLFTLLLPERTASEELARGIFDQVANACASIGAEVVGGHTEITLGLDRPIVIGQMLGEVARDRLVTSAGARLGDMLLLTKGVPVEGVSLLARERAESLRKAGVDDAVIDRARRFLHDPGISVVREAMLACEAAQVHAMHDPTEGGLATALWELSQAARLGIAIQEDEIAVFPAARQFAQVLDFDPLGLIASGALLICVAPEDADTVCRALRDHAIACRVIGEMVPQQQGITLARGAEQRPLPQFERDEIARLME